MTEDAQPELLPTHPAWLVEMPAAVCPEGCVLRRGDTLGVVQRLEDDRWTVAFLGSGIRESGNGAPEDDEFGVMGWRHALDHRNGFGYVLDETTRGVLAWMDSGRNVHGAMSLMVVLEELRVLHVRDAFTDDSYFILARAFAGVSR